MQYHPSDRLFRIMWGLTPKSEKAKVKFNYALIDSQEKPDEFQAQAKDLGFTSFVIRPYVGWTCYGELMTDELLLTKYALEVTTYEKLILDMKKLLVSHFYGSTLSELTSCARESLDHSMAEKLASYCGPITLTKTELQELLFYAKSVAINPMCIMVLDTLLLKLQTNNLRIE